MRILFFHGWTSVPGGTKPTFLASHGHTVLNPAFPDDDFEEAAWLVWKPAGLKAAALPLSLFVVQLLLNIAWSWIFFGLHQPGWAFAEIVVLWLAIVATTVAFFRCSQVAGWLLVPYLVWVSFATVLNFAIWRMNA